MKNIIRHKTYANVLEKGLISGWILMRNTVATFKISINIDTECLAEFLNKNANSIFMFHFT